VGITVGIGQMIGEPHQRRTVLVNAGHEAEGFMRFRHTLRERIALGVPDLQLYSHRLASQSVTIRAERAWTLVDDRFRDLPQSWSAHTARAVR